MRSERAAATLREAVPEAAGEIVIDLDVKLTSGDHARVASRGTRNLEAWLLRTVSHRSLAARRAEQNQLQSAAASQESARRTLQRKLKKLAP